MEIEMTFREFLAEKIGAVGEVEADSPAMAMALLINRYQKAQETLAAHRDGLDVSTSEDFQLLLPETRGVDYCTLIKHAHNFYGLHGRYTDYIREYDSLMMKNDEGKTILITFSIYPRTVMVTVQPVD